MSYLAFKEQEYRMMGKKINSNKNDRFQVYLVAAFWIAFIGGIAIYGGKPEKDKRSTATSTISKTNSQAVTVNKTEEK